MSDFVAFFPIGETRDQPPTFPSISRFFEMQMGADAAASANVHGASVLRVTIRDRTARFAVRDDPPGWIVLKGLIFDVTSESAEVDLDALLADFLSGEVIDWNRYEGTFAAAAWDAQRRTGLIINDQTSLLNLYYCESADGCYASTAAFPLAKSLGLGLDANAAKEFLARGALIAPTAMFASLARLSIGEQVTVSKGSCHKRLHWSPMEAKSELSGLDESADAAAEASVDCIRRYDAVGGPVILDLTAGYDSRLLASAADRAGLSPTVTVNGPPEEEDVWIALRVAAAVPWTMEHFDTREFWQEEIDADMRRELTFHTNGELPFTQVYHQRQSRPLLAADFNMHAGGVGGEFIRYHPWGQEFFGIGRRRMANVDNALKYRFLHSGAPPAGLFRVDWYPGFCRHLRSRIEAVCRDLPGTRTTHQLDAVHIWKMTGHTSLYVSAGYNWLPCSMPLMNPRFVDVGLATPWRMRVTARLTRRVTHQLCPRAADVLTRYGGTAGPMRPGNAHLHAHQILKRGAHLAGKVDKVVFKGKFFNRLTKPAAPVRKPYLTAEFRRFMEPKTMHSAAMYEAPGLERLLAGPDAAWYARESLILRLATIEQLCRELDFRPGPDFLGEAMD